MRKVDLSNLVRYQTGKYKGKIDWENNIGSKVKFTYYNIKGEITILNYVKDIPQGTLTLQYGDKILPMKTNNLTKASIGNLIGVFNKEYIHNVNDIISTSTEEHYVQVLKHIKLWHTKNYERGYIVKCLKCNHQYEVRECVISHCLFVSRREFCLIIGLMNKFGLLWNTISMI